MKKIAYVLILILLLGISFMLFTFPTGSKKATSNPKVTTTIEKEKKVIRDKKEKITYDVYRYDNHDRSFQSLDEAIAYGGSLTRAYITEEGEEAWVWDNFNSYIIHSGDIYLKDFDDFQSAFDYAKNFRYVSISYEDKNHEIWRNEYSPQDSTIIDVPIRFQYPELPRGCEVTSLAMLLSYHGVEITKMTLAQEIIKEPGMYSLDGTLYYGNPNRGFVGSMDSLSQFGFGVYEGPIVDLSQKYMPNKVLNLTDSEFSEFFYFLDHGMPIWVIINTTYDELGDNFFQVWNTKDGDVTITNKQHAVIVVGYDKDNIYINDPLGRKKSVPKEAFEKAWIQMGRQAVTIHK